MNVLYVQPYVAHYRVPLYDELEARLNERGHKLMVAAGRPLGVQAMRGDTGSGRWLTTVPSHSFGTPLGEFKFRSRLGILMRWADVCVMELDVGNLNAWAWLTRKDRPRIVLWGHGRSYTTASNPISEKLKKLQSVLADHVMTYTDSGRCHLVALGVDPERITSVGNTTDTVSLQRRLAERRLRTITRSETFGVNVEDRSVAMYVGGLDGDKRVHFLLEAAKQAAKIDPNFLLLVAGSGSDQSLVAETIPRGHVAWVEHADTVALADMAAVSSAIWMPGRVGLIAIDAMAAGRPVFTTNFAYHAPEFELLTPGVGRHVLSDEPASFAAEALRIMSTLSATPLEAAGLPTIAEVAGRMMKVIDPITRTPCRGLGRETA